MPSLGVASLGSEFDPSGLRQGLNTAQKDTENWLGGWRRIWEITAGVIIAGVVRKIGRAIADLGREVIDAVSSFQLLEIQLSGLVASETVDYFGGNFQAALENSTERVQDLIQWVKQLAVTTPFTVQSLQRTLSVAMAMGFTSGEAQSLTSSIGNFTAGMGLSNEVMERIIYNFGQMKAAGKVTGTELRDLARGGFVPIVKILEIMRENMGMTNMKLDDFRALAAKGEIDVNEFFTAFEQMASERFPNAMERMVRTWEGFKGNLQDFIGSVLGAGVFGPAFNNFTSQLSDAFGHLMTPSMQASFERLGVALSRLFDFKVDPASVAQRLLQFINRITNSVETLADTGSIFSTEFIESLRLPPAIHDGLIALRDWFETAGTWLVENKEDVKTALQGVAIGFGAIVGSQAVIGILTAVLSPLSLFLLLAAGIALAVAHWDEISAKFTEVKDAVVEFAAGVWSAIIERLQPAIDFFAAIWDVLQPTLQGLVEAIMPVWEQLKGAFADLQPAFQEFFTAIQPVIEFGKEFLINFFAILGVIILGVIGLIVGAINGIIQGVTFFMSVFQLILDGVTMILQGIIQFATGFWNVIQGIFTLNGDLIWQGLQQMFSGIINFIVGVVTTIAGLASGIFMFLVGLVSGFVQGVIGFFQNLWMTLVGGSIVPDLLNGILFWFTSVFTAIRTFVLNFIVTLINAFINFASSWITNIARAIQVVREKFLFFMSKGRELVSWMMSKLQPAFDAILKVINAVAGAIASVMRSFSQIAGSIPDIFIPGSPTPFEMGLRGIISAMHDLSSYALPDLGAGLNSELQVGGAGAGAGFVPIGNDQQTGRSVTFNMLKTELDEDQLQRALDRVEMLYG